MIRRYLNRNRGVEPELDVQSSTQQKRANEATATHTVVEIETKVLDQVVFLTVPEETDDIRDNVQRLEDTLRDGPASRTPKLTQFRQNSTPQFAVSIGDNSFGRTSIAFIESTKDNNSD